MKTMLYSAVWFWCYQLVGRMKKYRFSMYCMIRLLYSRGGGYIWCACLGSTSPPGQVFISESESGYGACEGASGGWWGAWGKHILTAITSYQLKIYAPQNDTLSWRLNVGGGSAFNPHYSPICVWVDFLSSETRGGRSLVGGINVVSNFSPFSCRPIESFICYEQAST